MASYSFEFATVSPEVAEQLKAMEPAKRVMLATKLSMVAGAPLNSVQAQALQVPEADESLRSFVESFDLESIKEICSNPEIKVHNSRINAILDTGMDVAIKFKDVTFGVF